MGRIVIRGIRASEVNSAEAGAAVAVVTTAMIMLLLMVGVTWLVAADAPIVQESCEPTSAGAQL